MKLRIEALDTLFFRDGKPFSAGEDSLGGGVFPPHPHTLYGALNTWLALANPALQAELYEAPKWEMRALYFELQQGQAPGFYFPMPLDLVMRSDAPQNVDGVLALEGLKPNETHGQTQSSSHSLPKYLHYYQKEVEVETPEALVSFQELQRYLREGYAEGQQFMGQAMGPLVRDEPKLGIARDKSSRTAREGMLYSLNLKRPLKGFSLCVEMDNLPENANFQLPLLKLGGENKAAYVQAMQEAESPRLERLKRLRLRGDGAQTLFKIYLASPAIFEQGSCPQFEGLDAELIAAAVGKPLAIGGFDLNAQAPKAMLKAVPAGSVYYFQTSASPEAVLNYFEGKTSISDYYAQQGFGLFFLGHV